MEIGCEEIPAQMIRKANQDLSEAIVAALGSLAEGAVTSAEFGGPRRIVSLVHGLRAREEDREETILGPPKSAAYDPEGRPTRAAEGFAKKLGVEAADLRVVAGPRGEVVAATRFTRGREAAEIVAEAGPRLLGEIRFAKMMRWGDEGNVFVRPIHWIVALLDDRVVPFEFAGVRSGRRTWGHRFLAPGPHEIPRAQEYESVLREQGAIRPRIEERRRMILDLASAEAGAAGGTLRPDDELVEELTFLTEHPAVVRGSFPSEYLDLPEPVLLTAMRHHQKYLTVQGANGRLLASFVAVLTTDADPAGRIRRGNEWVLKARLADAKFFFEEDQKRGLAERVGDLARITLHGRLGSYADKIARMERLLPPLAEALRLDVEEEQAAREAIPLAKADLTTGMVGEFPELQGIVGGIYARLQGYPERCARAIEEHYSPASPTEPVPSPGAPTAVMLSDRIDTLAVCFTAGLIPRGSADPYALRRSALGILRTLVENEIRLDLGPLLDRALDAAAGLRSGAGATAPERPEASRGGRGKHRKAAPADPRAALCEFLEQRLRFLMEDSGLRFDAARAALAVGWSDPLLAWSRAKALNALRGRDDFLALAVAAKRVRNILTQAAGKGMKVDAGSLDPAQLGAGAERTLFDAMGRVGAEADSLATGDNHLEALSAIASLRPVVDRFFDDVLVMDPEESVRRNRLALLLQLSNLLSREADFAEIVVEGESSA
jgi:glycyl-tRNA synthetase beta chain